MKHDIASWTRVPTPNRWHDAAWHPPRPGWYKARFASDRTVEFEAFCSSSMVWFKADYVSNGARTQGALITPLGHLEYQAVE